MTNLVKRSFDLVGAAAAIILLSPVLIAIAVFVRLLIGSPILFRQERSGLGAQSFEILKFRSMTDMRDDNGALLPDAERLSLFGRWLRASSLDELPELLNVATGDMSLVGPRPLLVQYVPLYTAEQARRHEVRPGITGWAQVNGRNALSWEEKFALDVWYVDHQSFWLDAKIIALTAWKVLKREGISQAGEATMPLFEGSAKK